MNHLLLISIISFIIPFSFGSQQAFADTITDKQMYDTGVSNGTIDSSISFDVWRKANSHPSPPIDAAPGYTLPTGPPMGSKFKPMASGGSSIYIKKGDILITDGTSSGGFTGHAAIVTSSNWVLDIPDWNSTTRQTRIKNWFDLYTSGSNTHIWVYRVSQAYSGVAEAAAVWADTHYYSSSGSSIQDIFPKYSVTPDLISTNPTYCSKIPFQAYYYGSGQFKFFSLYGDAMKGTIIAPYTLIDTFNDSYKPSLIYSFTRPTGWLQLNDKWYYYNTSGSPLYDWQLYGNTWYYLDPSTGEMVTGWKYLSGQWYYLNPGNISGYPTGAMITGWQSIGGNWYYLNPGNISGYPTGAMVTGWQSIGGNWYYLNPGDISGYPTGAMVTGTQIINGKVYHFDSSGKWIS